MHGLTRTLTCFGEKIELAFSKLSAFFHSVLCRVRKGIWIVTTDGRELLLPAAVRCSKQFDLGQYVRVSLESAALRAARRHQSPAAT